MSVPFQRSVIQGVVCSCSSEEDNTAAIPKVSPSLKRFRILLPLGSEGISAESGDTALAAVPSGST
jgi:hypothetical protein